MEFFGTIALIIVVSVTAFLIGAVGMARWKNSKTIQEPEKMPTRETVYAAHVVNTAAEIYCNYSESKIIRPGINNQTKKDRQGEALQEALNLVGAAYRYFDMVDSEPKKINKGIGGELKKVNLNIN